MEPALSGQPKRVAFISSSLPRKCGIATFTNDLSQSLRALYKHTEFFSVALTDTGETYSYPSSVRFEIADRDIASYHRAADFLNINNVDLVCVQHEYGLFGGPAGSHVLALLRELRMSVVTTLHTVLEKPDRYQRAAMEQLSQLSDRMVVMSEKGKKFLREVHSIPDEKIDMIHHGIPDVPFVDPNFYKDQFSVAGKTVILTFGLLSPNKGIENVIEALPGILAKHPDTVFLVVGATHPHLKRHEGEGYRLSLERLARERNVEDNVIFHNRFVSTEELVEFLCSADIYVTPYLNPEQITSGTLAYATGAGKAVISTPYWYAEELLDEGRGVIVPFADPKAMTEKVLDLLDNDTARHAMRKRAYMLGREMIWPRVAQSYMECFTNARDEGKNHSTEASASRPSSKRLRELPLFKLDHIRRMTDGAGIFQHAMFTIPDRNEGYSIDDVARALILCVLLEEAGETSLTDAGLPSRYLSFISYAFNTKKKRFRNFLSYDRKWLEEVGSEDSHGRSLWALGTVLGRSQHEGLRGLASRLFAQSLETCLKFTSPRTWAFTLISIHEYLRKFSGDLIAQNVRVTLADRLVAAYKKNRSDDWPWFEPIVAYSNAKLSHAMLLCGQWMEREEMKEIGLESLEWLMSIQMSEAGNFAPIGSNGFYPKGGERARFDQQPIEAHATISACLEAHRMTQEDKWRRYAQCAFDWFLGRNDLMIPLYDSATGGCRDGLHPDRPNLNQGAESTLAFLLSLVEMRLAENIISED